jgi:ubiquinone/menaquinone biosynthesis C-methylase UbiE
MPSPFPRRRIGYRDGKVNHVDYHDVLATVGAGSAHPGGYGTTLAWLDHVAPQPTDSILDVGCGTGRTLTTIHQRYGSTITGVDIRPAMIRKAKQRSKALGIRGKWIVGSAEHLPLSDESFQVTFTESVNVFVDVQRALRQNYRVLQDGGTYVDVEMMLIGPAPVDFYSTAREMYGARQVPDLRTWKGLYHDAGFTRVKVLSTQPVRPMEGMVMDEEYSDEVQLADANAYQNPLVLQVLRRNSEWLERYYKSLAYGIFICRKENGEG